MLKRQTRKQINKKKSPSQNQTSNQRPLSVPWGRQGHCLGTLSWLAGRQSCSSSDVTQKDMTTRRHTAAGAWGSAWGRALTAQLYFSASLAWLGLPPPRSTVSKCAHGVSERLHNVPPHAHTAAKALPCQGQWEFLSLTLVQAGFPSMGTHLLPDACACECLCIYICFTVQSTYRKASSLFKCLSSTLYCMKSDPHCRSRSFSQLNGVEEPLLLPTAAITIRLGGRGNEQCSTHCTFYTPAIVKSTLLQTEWQQGTGWEAGVTCQKHQSSKSQFLLQTSTPPAQLPLATKPNEILHSCCPALHSLTNAFMANQELILSSQHFGRSSAKSLIFFFLQLHIRAERFMCNSLLSGSTFSDPLLQFGYFTEESGISPACLPCLSNSF